MLRFAVSLVCLSLFQSTAANPGDGCCFFPQNYPGVAITGFSFESSPDSGPFGVSGSLMITAAIKKDGSVASRAFNGSMSVTYLVLQPPTNNSYSVTRYINADSSVSKTECISFGPPSGPDNSICYGVAAQGRVDPGSDSPIYNGTMNLGGKDFEVYSANATAEGFYDTSVYLINLDNCLPVADLSYPQAYMQNFDPDSIDNSPSITYANARTDGVFPDGLFDLPQECTTARRMAPRAVSDKYKMRKIAGVFPFMGLRKKFRSL